MGSQTPGAGGAGGANERATGPPDGPGPEEGLLRFAIGYPSRRGLKPLLIGTVFTLFSILIIPAFFVAGYMVRLTRAAIRGEPEPPAFDDWGDIFVDGLGLLVVFIPVLIVYWLLLFVTGEIHWLLNVLVALAFAYVAPSIYLSYAVSDSWFGAYDTGRLQRLLTHRTYAIGLLLYVLVINGIGFLVAVFLMTVSLLTIVGWIVIWPLIIFYWYAIDAALWGRVYNRIEAP
ncbi:DUF4013 domain-containing protein [Natrarchaeobaculum aegyptiacum]|uniref:DUF4013 domain-containing protein n=1 Tax=Natrarchaeobaculum aegyptiacum TaxID=745377 RepID=A0A2Z2I0B2_9EURY|nr:DUF4013 domain-containing protein [Natrarchaeobaculum aegyptiacum]ARS89578.1 hypothetical protein B1756_07375 [Natrarchaeobaculum aegyptiacum]